jgi:CubicO group peptidase (beta-lactamase class C family)
MSRQGQASGTSLGRVTRIDDFRGVGLVQRGSENLVAVSGGTTGGDADTPCGPDIRFQVASVSKSFTAAAVLLLAERSVLSVTDPVGRWLADCPASWDAITLHHLLSNTSGMAHWEGLGELDLTVRTPAKELLRVFRAAELLSPPGTRFSYSSPGFALLGQVVEQASGQPYASFLARELFAPAGMTATFAGNGTGLPGMAAGHQAGEPVLAPFELDTVGMGAGDIWSTPGDLARWDRALAAGQVLSEATVAAMLTVRGAIEDDDGIVRTEGYGYGWFLGSVLGGHPIVYHPGDNIGFRSFNAWFPDDDVRIIMLTNEGTTDVEPIVHQLLEVAFAAVG